MPRRKGQSSPILRTTPSPTNSTEGNRRPSPSFAEFQDFLAQTAAGTTGAGGGNGGTAVEEEELSEALLSSLVGGGAGAKEGWEGDVAAAGPSHGGLGLGIGHRKRRRSQLESCPAGTDGPPPRTRSRLGLPHPLPLSLELPQLSPPLPANLPNRHSSRRSTPRSSQRPSPSASHSRISPLNQEWNEAEFRRPSATPSPSASSYAARHSDTTNLHLLAAAQAQQLASASYHSAGRAHYEAGGSRPMQESAHARAAHGAQNALFPDMCCVVGSRSQRCQLPHPHSHEAQPMPPSRQAPGPSSHHHQHHPQQHQGHQQTEPQPISGGLRRSQSQDLEHLTWQTPFIAAPAAQPTFADFLHHSFLSAAGQHYGSHNANAHLFLHLMGLEATAGAAAGVGPGRAGSGQGRTGGGSTRTPAPVSSLWENREALIQVAQRMAQQYQHHPRGLTKSQINELPLFKYLPESDGNGEDHRNDGDSICVVCLFNFLPRQNLRVLPCSHHFHVKCIDKWLKTNRTCPICRGDAGQYLSRRGETGQGSP